MRSTTLESTDLGGQGVSPPIISPTGDMPTVCAALRSALAPHRRVDVVRPAPDPRRDDLLGNYRRALLAHVRHDAQTNAAEVRVLVCETADRCGLDPTRTPLGADLLARLQHSCDTIMRVDPYRDGKAEFRWWLALTQFYLDGLFLADRLLTARRGEPHRRWRLPRRRVEFLGFSAPGSTQALVTALETAVPDIFRVNPFATYMPTLLHLSAHHVFPGKRFRFTDMLATTRGWIHRGGFNKLRRVRGATVRFEGLEHLRNELLFDGDTGRTRHNVIIAASHRLGYLDIPLFYEPLRRMRLGVWANNAFYGPGMERKIAGDRYTIPIAGNHAPPLADALAQTAELLIDARVPVFIMVDGRQPSLFYGQQMRVKTGLRLAVNEAVRRSHGTGRRTYCLPVSLNDPVGFVQGRQDVIRVSFHPPVLVEAVLELKAPEPQGIAMSSLSGPPGPLINQLETPGASGAPSFAPRDVSTPLIIPGKGWGTDSVRSGTPDPLINHLEALFLLETAHAEQGLPRPRIVAAVRQRLEGRNREPLLKRWFHTSIADLARQAAQTSV